MTILIIGGGVGLWRRALIAAMVTLNAQIINAPTTLEWKLRPQETSLAIDSIWTEMVYKESTQKTYGPAKKGRGGKVKKWQCLT